MNKTLGEYYEKYRHSSIRRSMYTVTIASLSNENVDVPAIMNSNQKLHFFRLMGSFFNNTTILKALEVLCGVMLLSQSI